MMETSGTCFFANIRFLVISFIRGIFNELEIIYQNSKKMIEFLKKIIILTLEKFDL